MKIYFLEFILTTKCNQQCSYCNVFNINKEETKLEIDLDFLKYVLKFIPKDTKIEFCGGEPGILSNLDEAFNIVNNTDNVKAIQIMSNGLVRKTGYDWLENDNVWYCEHLVKEIDDKKIIKFYDELDFIKKPRWKYVIVTTYKTIKSLLLNRDYYKELGMFDDMFWYKLMNPKTEGVQHFILYLEEFFKKLQNETDLYYVDLTMQRIDELRYSYSNLAIKELCGLNSPLLTINFETKELVHCSAYLEHSTRFEFNETNFKKHLNCDLFKGSETYCRECYIYNDDGLKSLLACKRGRHYNQEIKG